jgi:hypothetical protein
MPTLHETFTDRVTADRAIQDLIASGISPDDISIVMTTATKETFLPSLDGDLAKGGVGGAVLGGLAAVAGGLVLLAGGVSGVAVGTLIGGLCGAGVAETDAHAIESHVKAGAVAVVVKATTENAPDVDEILRKDNSGAEPTTT